MPLPSWPSGVPAIARDGWQIQQLFASLDSTEMEGNNQRLRARPGGNVAVFSYPLAPITVAEWETLRAWIRDTLNNGASRWTMSVLTGTAYETKTVQFEQGKSPTVSQSGKLVSVVLPLRVYGM